MRCLFIFLNNMIEITNIHKSFGPKTVLQGINLNIPDNDILCIIGKSGCGKSVLIKIIVGLLEPDIGTVAIDNRIVSQLSKKELYMLRRKFGFVFQSAALFDSLNVFENVVLGLYEHGERDMKYLEQEAKRVLQAVGLLPPLEDNKLEFEKEWEILRNKMPADLSGGMKKRVGVARALVGNPEYIFYDEPTTGLDPVTSEQIDDLISELSHKLKVTSIIITHDMFSVYKIANRVVMLHDGKVQFEGSPDMLSDSKDPIVQEFLDRYKNNK